MKDVKCEVTQEQLLDDVRYFMIREVDIILRQYVRELLVGRGIQDSWRRTSIIRNALKTG